ncbi:hypothetical protein GALL_550480 [mine drainage metagenome]|uniref:Deaminase n=1 Tax=mine drainage metagenome TaxID=410659 RepID=A0A1J5NXB1_9ZZZZ
MKLLLLILVVAAAWWLLRGLRIEVHTSAQPGTKRPPGPGANPTPRLPVPMVSCAFCGLHLPRDEAFDSPNRLHYCSEAHRIEHMKQRACGSAQGPR